MQILVYVQHCKIRTDSCLVSAAHGSECEAIAAAPMLSCNTQTILHNISKLHTISPANSITTKNNRLRSERIAEHQFSKLNNCQTEQITQSETIANLNNN